MGGDGTAEEIKYGSALLITGGNRRPDSFAPSLSRLAARTLCQATMNCHESNGLFRQVVRRLDARCRNEAEVALGVRQKIFDRAEGLYGRHNA
jgi:hypothetical protein